MYWFCHTLTWIHHGCPYVPHTEPPTQLPPHPIPLGHPSAPAPSILFLNKYSNFLGTFNFWEVGYSHTQFKFFFSFFLVIIGSFYVWSCCIFQVTFITNIVLISCELICVVRSYTDPKFSSLLSFAHIFCVQTLLWFWTENERDHWREVWWIEILFLLFALLFFKACKRVISTWLPASSNKMMALSL